MEERSNRHVLNVFIGSPGDLSGERAATKEIVSELNEIIGRTINWHIELFGWEDTRPGFGRPQELINREVDECHIFIGVLWRRWGTATGEFSSGFEEEFERARKRRQAASSPEIWLCFKRVDQEQVDDPGEDLKRVLEFRETQVSRREVLFKDFIDLSDWRSNLLKWLLSYVLEESRRTPEQAGGPKAVGPPKPQSREVSSDSSLAVPVSPPSLKQIDEVVAFLNTAIVAGNIDHPPKEPELMDAFKVARLYLLSMTWISLQNTDSLLGVHEINLLYKHRQELQESSAELLLLLRTALGDANNTLPGWYWLRYMEPVTIIEVILERAFLDPSERVKKAALRVLKLANIRPTGIWAALVIPELKEGDHQRKKELLSYLAKVGDLDELTIIDTISTDSDQTIVKEAKLARLMIIARHNPTRALTEVVTEPIVESVEIVAEIQKNSDSIDTGSLLFALQQSDENAKAFAVRELAQRGEIPKERIREVLNASAGKVKAACYYALIKQGEEFDGAQILADVLDEPLAFMDKFQSRGTQPNAASLLLQMYKSFPVDRLLDLAEWSPGCGAAAYHALALYHFPQVASLIRRDLNHKFEELKTRYFDSLRAQFGDAAKSLIDSYQKRLVSFIDNALASGALAGLAENGESVDVEIARRYLSSTDYDVQTEAVKIVERFGDRTDAHSLIAIANNSWGKLQVLAARAALKVAPGIRGAASELLDSGKTNLIAVTINSLLSDRSPEVEQILEQFLDNEQDDTRSLVLAYFVKNFSREQLEQLLQRYLGRPSYYYNVVYWLDRILYAPDPIRESFERELCAKLIH